MNDLSKVNTTLNMILDKQYFRINELESQNKRLIEALKRLSQTGDGSHGDKHASFYDCLPTLQIEFDERIGFARDVLKEIEND